MAIAPKLGVFTPKIWSGLSFLGGILFFKVNALDSLVRMLWHMRHMWLISKHQISFHKVVPLKRLSNWSNWWHRNLSKLLLITAGFYYWNIVCMYIYIYHSIFVPEFSFKKSVNDFPHPTSSNHPRRTEFWLSWGAGPMNCCFKCTNVKKLHTLCIYIYTFF